MLAVKSLEICIKKILITGAKGFLGSNVSRHFKSLGYETYGIGHGGLSTQESRNLGLDYWKKSDISINAILEFNQTFDVIVHCGGSGSVGFSIQHPYEDFKKTVDGTLEVLEYIRLHNPSAHLIYPSSPAVQGEHPDSPISESFVGKPASPYGYHKKIAENLCQSYAEKYDLNVVIIRLFSVYGIGLRKQLLWDAVNKIQKSTSEEVVFWGTGAETRDFIHVDDVLNIFSKLLVRNTGFMIINGGTGVKHSIKEVLEIIKDLVNPRIQIKFNNQINIGNPIYYWADIHNLRTYDCKTSINFRVGIESFITWALNEND